MFEWLEWENENEVKFSKTFPVFSQSIHCSIHIRSRPVIQDDSKVVCMTKITSKVVLWTSKVLLSHNTFSKFSYNVIMNIICTGVLITSHPLEPLRTQNRQNYCPDKTTAQTKLLHRTMCLWRAALHFAYSQIHKTLANHARATQILPRQVYHQAYLPG